MQEDQKFLSEEGIRDFDRSLRDFLGLSDCPGYALEPLVAGVRIELLYEKGKLCSSALGEDAHPKEDITRHVKTILSVPLSLSPINQAMCVPDLLRVWGMVYTESRAVGRAPVSGPRVLETLMQPDLRRTARQPLNLFCHGASHPGRLGAELGVRTHYEMMRFLQDLGFRVNRPHIRVCSEITEVVDYSFQLKEDRAGFPYRIRGVLVTLNPLARVSRIEEMASGPRWVVAFGFGES